MRTKLFLTFILCLATQFLFATTPSTPNKNVSKAASNFVRSAPLPKWTQPLAEIPTAKHDDTVVVRLAETQAWVGPNPAVMYNSAIQVNGKSALGNIGQFGISYVPAYQKLLLHRVALLRGKDIIDRTASVNTRLLEREAGLENGVYGGATTVQLLLEDVHVGDTLWLTYTVEGINPVFGSLWSDTFEWDSANPVESRKLTILHPKNRPLQWRTLGDFKSDEVKPVIEQIGTNERLVFSEQGMEALDYEVSTPSNYISHRRLHLSEYNNWHDVAVWAHALFPQVPATPATMALTRKFAQQGDRLAQASAALHWVQDEIRYFSMSMGENSHRPQRPEVVLKLRYGDCKDKSYLLVSLLRELGIKATPVLVNARSPLLPGKLLPTPNQFDHVIVQIEIDGNLYNVDPTRTSEKGLLSTLTPALPGGQGLIVDPTSMALSTLSESTMSAPFLERFEKISVDALDGNAILELRKIYRRRYAEYARLSLPSMSGTELRKHILEQYEKQYPGISLIETPTLKDSDDGTNFELTAKFKLIKPVSHKDGLYSIEFDSKVVDDTLGIPPKLIRNFPFELPMGRFRASYHLDIIWPQNVRANYVIDPRAIDTPFFTLRENIGLRGNHFHYNADYAVKRAEIAASELPELQIQAKALLEKLKVRAIVQDSELVKQEGMGVTMRNLEIIRTGLGLMRYSQLYSKSKFEDLPIVDACDTFINAVALENTLQNALLHKNVDDMLAANSGRPGFQLCRARLKFSTGDFATSVPLFVAAKKTDEVEPSTMMLAWARFYSGSDQETIKQDLLRYYEERKRNGTLSGYDIADTVALSQRLGIAVPFEIENSKQMATDLWPLPIVAMQLGSLSISSLLEMIDGMPDDERELAANDANFYIAQKYLVQGNIQLAIDTLRWYPPNGQRTSRIGQQAIAELWRLTHDDADLVAGIDAASKNDFVTAYRLYVKAAERGIPVAQYRLGTLYYFGDGVQQDTEKALHWFRIAASNNVPGAMNFLGNMFSDGKGVAVDKARSIQWYEVAAKFGDFHASSNLGLRYLYGDLGINQDYAKAFRHLRHASELGNTEAQHHLSYMYTEGKGITKDYALAAFWAGFSAASGNPGGMLRLGILKRHGYGIEKDQANAIKLFESCAKQGWHSCKYQLALIYEAGDGVKQDLGKAQELFERAAAEGDAQAQVYVAQRMLEKDLSSEKARTLLLKAAWSDEEKALQLLGEMAERSLKAKPDITLLEELGRLRKYGPGSTLNYVEAAKWYSQAVELGSSFAMNNLGDMYENGFGVEKNLDKALMLYRRSASHGYGIAFYSLGILYEKGLGVQVNPRLAYFYYELAVEKGVKPAIASRKKLGKELPTTERQAAEALAAAWDPSQSIPLE